MLISENVQYNFIEDYSIWKITDAMKPNSGLTEQRDSADVTSS